MLGAAGGFLPSSFRPERGFVAEKNAKKREVFRDQVYEAALHLFATRGINGVSMRALAKVMGSSTMKTYHYFRDKNEVLADVLTRTFNRFCDTLDAAADIPGTAVEQARAKRMAYIQFAMEEPESYRIMFELAHPTEEDYPAMQAAMDRTRASMRNTVAALLSEGVVAGDIDFLGHALWSAIHGPVSLYLAGKLTPGIDPVELVDSQITGLLVKFAPEMAH